MHSFYKQWTIIHDYVIALIGDPQIWLYSIQRVPQGQMSKLNKHTYFTGFEFQFEFITIPTLCWAVQVGQGNSYLRGVHEMTRWGRGSNVWFMFTFAVLLKMRFSLYFLKDNFWYSVKFYHVQINEHIMDVLAKKIFSDWEVKFAKAGDPWMEGPHWRGKGPGWDPTLANLLCSKAKQCTLTRTGKPLQKK